MNHFFTRRVFVLFFLAAIVPTAALLGQDPRQSISDQKGARMAPFEAKKCPTCSGKKLAPCTTCDAGKKELPARCFECRGKRKAPCRTCCGKGETYDSFLFIRCPRCEGRGMAKCDGCGGKGEFDRKVSCRVCKKKAAFKCTYCKGARLLPLSYPGKKKPESMDFATLTYSQTTMKGLFDRAGEYAKEGGLYTMREFEKIMVDASEYYPFLKKEVKAVKKTTELMEKKMRGVSKLRKRIADVRRNAMISFQNLVVTQVNALNFLVNIEEFNRKSKQRKNKKSP